jgi:hypothetical protein
MVTVDELVKIAYEKLEDSVKYTQWKINGEKTLFARVLEIDNHDILKLCNRMNNANKIGWIVFVPSFVYFIDGARSKGLFYVVVNENKILYKTISLESACDFFNDWLEEKEK